ncbi:methyltransferase domain-containing protein [Candidatus Peregrinibacteria bacterium]|nr:MAG: methyltransferase domain-containing protein [Candidatus Peregrinibacteria bacterium]
MAWSFDAAMIDFDAIQKTLNQSFAIYRDSHQGALPFTDALFCAQDVIRNRAFFQAIQIAVTDLKFQFHSVYVIDAGCGTGLLGLYALLSGADQCVFIDNNPDAIAFTRLILTQFQLMDRATIVLGDAKLYQPSHPFHLLISETIVSGFVEEDFLPIITHLKTYLEPEGLVIPQAFQVKITERPSGSAHSISLESKTIPTDFSVLPSDSTVEVIELAMDTQLYGAIWLKSGDCLSYCNPRILQ